MYKFSFVNKNKFQCAPPLRRPSSLSAEHSPFLFPVGTTTDSYDEYVQLQNEKNTLKTEKLELDGRKQNLRDAEALAKENGSFKDEDFRGPYTQLAREMSTYNRRDRNLEERLHAYCNTGRWIGTNSDNYPLHILNEDTSILN